MRNHSQLGMNKVYKIFTSIAGVICNPLKMLSMGRALFWEKNVLLELPTISEFGGIKSDFFTYSDFEVPTRLSSWDINLSDLFWLVQLLKQRNPKRILEFGTYSGLSTLYFAKYSDPDAIVTTLDLPDPFFDQTKPQSEVSIGMRFRNTSYESKIRRVSVDLRNLDTSCFEKQDFIFVDAEHHYDDVKRDTENALRLVSDHGMIVWHDYNLKESEAGVVRYLNDLNRELRTIKHIEGHNLAIYEAQPHSSSQKPLPSVKHNSPPHVDNGSSTVRTQEGEDALVGKLITILGGTSYTLIDVGCRWGIDSRWRPFGESLRVIGFEPDREESDRLSKCLPLNHSVFPVALSNLKGQELINLTHEPGRSSLYEPNYGFLKRYPDCDGFQMAGKMEVGTETLDDFLRQEKISEVDFVKLDAQGSEKKIVEGGFQTLRDLVFGLEVEVEFSMLYQQQPLFSEVDNICQKIGFTLFDLKPCYWKRTTSPIKGIGQLICADVLYFKDHISSGFVPDSRAAAAAILSCLAYEKYDYALELLRYYFSCQVYSSRTYTGAEQIIRRLSNLVFPFNKNFRGKMRVANFLDTMSQRLKTSHWARWDDWQV